MASGRREQWEIWQPSLPKYKIFNQLDNCLFCLNSFFFLPHFLLLTFISSTLIYILLTLIIHQHLVYPYNYSKVLSFLLPSTSSPLMKNQPHHRFNCPSDTLIKSPSAATIKSEKALKLLIVDTNNNKPFRRKQEAKGNRKSQFQDLGKVITNTSFGANPDIKKIVSTSPKHYFGLHQNWQVQGKTQCMKTILRENRSITDIEKIRENIVTNKKGSYIEKTVINRQEISNSILAELHKDHWEKIISELKIKLSDLRRDHQILEGKSKVLSIQILQLHGKIAEKQEQLSSYKKELTQKTEQLKQQAELNKCLQEMISNFQEKQSQEISRIQSSAALNKEHELRRQVEELNQTVYGFKKMANALQIQNSVIQKLRHELEKQRDSNRGLQKEVRYLKQKISGITKSSRSKVNKFLVKQQLDYSVSFDLQ